MLRAIVKVDDETYKFEDETRIRKIIILRRDSTASKFPVLELSLEKEDPKYKEIYLGRVRAGPQILTFVDFEYEERNGVWFYERQADFDANEYEFLANKTEIEVLLDFQ